MWSVEEPQLRWELQEGGLRESIKAIRSIIQNATKEVPRKNIILAGISQGCATAIHALLHEDQKLGGFIGLCSWLPYESSIDAACEKATSTDDRLKSFRALAGLAESSVIAAGTSVLDTPVFLAQCQDDDVVPLAIGRSLSEKLQALGLQVQWHEYEDGGHWLNEPAGVEDIAGFLDRVMAVNTQPDKSA